MNNIDTAKRLVWLVFCLVSLFLIFQIFTIILEVQSTGQLVVTTSDKSSQISVSQENSQPKLIGTGSAHVRLPKGSYSVYAIGSGKRASTIVTIGAKQTTTTSLSLGGNSLLPSVDNISFYGTDSLLDYGLSSPQVVNLKQAIFQYSNGIKKVNVDTGSIVTAPHDRNSSSTDSSITFNLSIDSKNYNAKIAYPLIGENVRLYLYSPVDNSLQYDSGAANSSSGD